jgi:hypothetical protein
MTSATDMLVFIVRTPPADQRGAAPVSHAARYTPPMAAAAKPAAGVPQFSRMDEGRGSPAEEEALAVSGVGLTCTAGSPV